MVDLAGGKSNQLVVWLCQLEEFRRMGVCGYTGET